MTFKEFNEIIKNDAELQKKFEEAKESCKNEGIKDKNELLSKAASKMGYDVPASEFQLSRIGIMKLDDSELEAVTGGKRVECKNDFEDTDCWSNDYCQFFNNQYTLVTCLYTHDGYCANEDACYQIYQMYFCPGDFTVPV